mgnify:FL=1
MTGYAMNFGNLGVPLRHHRRRRQNAVAHTPAHHRDWVGVLTALGGIGIVGAGTMYLTKQVVEAVWNFFSSELERAKTEWYDAKAELDDMISRRDELTRQIESQEPIVAALFDRIGEIERAQTDVSNEPTVEDEGSGSFYY